MEYKMCLEIHARCWDEGRNQSEVYIIQTLVLFVIIKPARPCWLLLFYWGEGVLNKTFENNDRFLGVFWMLWSWISSYQKLGIQN